MENGKFIMVNNYKTFTGTSFRLSAFSLKFIAFCFILFTFYFNSQAQSPAARYEIDAKRQGVSMTDKDALPRGREFIRLDSTYYVGWMYTGMYKEDKAADFLGYKQCIPDLLKAFKLLEKDFGGALANQFSSPQAFVQNQGKFFDYLNLAAKLREVYEDVDLQDSVMWVLDRVAKKNFRRDMIGIGSYRAWTVHRNRFFTSKEHAWLKNSVEENEELAKQYCYNQLEFIRRNKAENDKWWGPNEDQQDRMNVYHYMAMLSCYNRQYDSSEYYYDLLKSGGIISWNNYGGMKGEIGEFKESIENFSKDKYKYSEIKFLREPFYYLPTLSVYGGNTKEAMATAQEAIEASNSTPGWGWYNLALARGYLYDGQLDSAETTLNKAKEFHEIHIGTTLTQPQYDFTEGLLRLVWYNKKIEQIKFFNKGWWYSPSSLSQVAVYTVQKYMQQYLLATKLASNPERERLIYELFCSEGTTTWDESWFLLKDFSTGFFVNKMEEYEQKDTRKNIKRYFDLYHAMLLNKDGDDKKSLAEYENILNTTLMDTAHEKLFLARMYQGLAQGYNNSKDNGKRDFYTNLLYEHFPQLTPYSGLPIKLKLNTIGDEDATIKKVIEELKKCNINFVDAADENTITANVSFKKKGIKYQVFVSAVSGSNVKMVNNNIFYFSQPDGAGQEIAKRIFGSSGASELELPVATASK